MPTKEALIDFIQQFLEARGVAMPVPELSHYPIFSSGALDSFELLTLTMSLEAHFDVPVPPEVLLEHQQSSVDQFIAALLVPA